MHNKKVPVTIITGFFGSGKTTLLNRIIESSPAEKIAVIKNELNGCNIDSLLITLNAQQITAISDGCICCTAGSSLTEAIIDIAGGDCALDHIIIETSGAAHIQGILRFLLNEYTRQYITISNVICVADSLQLCALQDMPEETREQITNADVIVLNDKGAVNNKPAKAIREMIQGINPFAEIVPSIALLNSYKHLYSGNTRPAIAVERNLYETLSPCSRYHYHSITPLNLRFNTPFDFITLEYIFRQLQEHPAGDVHYIKGLICAAGFDSAMIIQSARGVNIWQTAPALKLTGLMQSNIVFVGKNPDKLFFQTLVSDALTINRKRVA
ncbi:MAG TPA: CobW family GTP-binding protein [Chitinophagaceae bacterium]|nr:CobW family GTP-binding protein [Chitinophagaceae bacterium]